MSWKFISGHRIFRVRILTVVQGPYRGPDGAIKLSTCGKGKTMKEEWTCALHPHEKNNGPDPEVCCAAYRRLLPPCPVVSEGGDHWPCVSVAGHAGGHVFDASEG